MKVTIGGITSTLILVGVLSAQTSALLDGCEALIVSSPDKVFTVGSPVYDYEVTNLWSNYQILSPSCVYRPTNARDVASGLINNQLTQTKFAVRGGGHMGIRGANSIDNGPLIVMSNLTTLELAEDRQSVWVGSGLNWGDVYAYLDRFGLTAAGGRLSAVGVPGLLLAGGINFHGNQHGWAADNVIEYEIVLYAGQIVTVNQDTYPDLFWALKGGGNNFGIITKFRLKTFQSGTVYAGIYTVTDIPAMLKAAANYSAFNTDPLSHVVPQIVFHEDIAVGAVFMYYDDDKDEKPACFQPFWDLPSVGSTFSKTTVYQFTQETGKFVVPEINNMFIAGTTVGKGYDEILHGLEIVWNTFSAELPKLFSVLPAEDRQMISIDWQPLGTLWLSASKSANPGGNALGFSPDIKGTYLAWSEVIQWRGENYYPTIHNWIQSTTSAIEYATKLGGVYDSFNYVGQAADFQDVFSGYGEENKQKLLSISRKYDPLRYLQTLWPGGFKLYK